MAPKAKPQKMALGDFLGDQTLGSWADEMEDSMPVSGGRGDSRTGYGGGERRAFSSAATFGGSDRTSGFARMDPADRPGFARQALPLPTKPPYTAHLGNLAYDVTNIDVEEFFTGCEVSSVRIVEDKLEHKPKGFGYVEFRSLEGLKKALELDSTQFQGRSVRISIAEPSKERAEGRVLDDWSRKGPLPDLPAQQQRRPSERAGGFGMERGGSQRGAPQFPEGDGRSRDFGNWERRGPLSPGAEPTRGPPRERTEGAPRESRPPPNWGEARDGSRPPREFQERQERPERPVVERQPTAADMDNKWRDRMRPDAPVESATPTPEQSAPASPAQPAAPAQRPRLNLAKRTVSEAVPSEPLGTSDPSKPNPFGGARAVDTAAREAEVAEKREIAIREKKEADDKAREERKASEAAAKEAAAAEKSAAVDGEEASGDAPKENGAGAGVQAAKANYQILSRINDEENDTDEKSAVDGPANGEITDDKNVKPREFTRAPPRGPRSNQGPPRDWRRKASNPSTPTSEKPESTAEAVEDDGFTVVASRGKQNSGRGRGGGDAPRGGGRGRGRGGDNAGRRALAS